MSGDSSTAEFLSRARLAFNEARNVGEAFEKAHATQRSSITSDAPFWGDYQAKVNALWNALAQLRGPMQHPPAGTERVVDEIRRLDRCAREVLSEVRAGSFSVESYPDLLTIARDGYAVVHDAPSLSSRTEPPTTGDHVRFLEHVRDDVQYAAESKRQQLARGYSNDTLANTVRGIKWAEANDRIAQLTDLPVDVTSHVARVLRRELTVGTVEQIDELLAPAVRNLRDAYEEWRVAAELETQFDAILDAAVHADESEKQKQVRQFWLHCGMPPTMTYEEGQAWARQEQQRRDAADATFRAKVRSLERLIEKRCRQRMLDAGFRDEEMQGLYVPSLPAHVKGDDPRWHAHRAEFDRLKLEEKVMDRVLVRDSAHEESKDTKITMPLPYKSAGREFDAAIDEARLRELANRDERAARDAEVERRQPVAIAWGAVYEAAGQSPKSMNADDYETWLKAWAKRLMAFIEALKGADYTEGVDRLEPRPGHDADDKLAIGLLRFALGNDETAVLERLKECPRPCPIDGTWWPGFFNHDLPLAIVEATDEACDAAYQPVTDQFVADQQVARQENDVGVLDGPPKTPKQKRSTVRGEAREKLISALTQHHQYAEGGCLNLVPIGSNALARKAGIAERSAASASRFFAKEFGGYSNYRTMCGDPPRLVAALKALNGEFRPRDFLNARTPDQIEPSDG